MKTKKSGVSSNPLFEKTENTIPKIETTKDGMSTKQHNDNEASKQVIKSLKLQRRTFYIEEPLFKQLKRFAFEKEEKIYHVVNKAIKSYLENNPL